jgi:hypothetical protein
MIGGGISILAKSSFKGSIVLTDHEALLPVAFKGRQAIFIVIGVYIPPSKAGSKIYLNGI